MKKSSSRFMQFTSSIVLVMFISAGLISCGSGGSGSNIPIAIKPKAKATELKNPDQAGSVANMAMGSLALADMLLQNADIVGINPGKPTKSIHSEKPAGLDPRLKEAVDRMAGQLHAPALINAKTKAAPGKGYDSYDFYCDGGGTIVLSRTENLTETYYEYDVTYRFNACRDTFALTELTGSFREYRKELLDRSIFTRRMIATNFTQKEYTADFAALEGTSRLNITVSASTLRPSEADGTFNNIESDVMSEVKRTFKANGTFTETPAALSMVKSLQFDNLSIVSTWAAGTETTTDTMNGSFGFDYKTGDGVVLEDFNIAYSSFAETWTYIDAAQQVSYNGRITINTTPDDSCREGVLDFTTPLDKPLVFTSIDGYSCPVSGTLEVNNASIVFGSPITITVGTEVPVEISDCNQFGGSLCMVM